MVEIRKAKFADIPEFRRMMFKALDASHYNGVAHIDKDAFRRGASEMIQNQTDTPGTSMTMVAEDGAGGLCAVFSGVVQPLYQCMTMKVASNLIWYAEPGASGRAGLGVLDAFMAWADQDGQPVLHRYGISDAIINHHAIGALLVRRRGFRLAGGIYERGL